MSYRPTLAALTLTLAASAALAGTPLGGLAVARSPDGKRLVCGGDSRTLYVLDGETLAVTKRVWSGTSIVRLGFSKDGGRLWVEDSAGDTRVRETENFEVVHELKKASYLAFSRGADMVVALDANYKGHVLTAYSMADASIKGKLALPKGVKVSSFVADPTGTKLALITKGETDESEPKLSSSKAPKELKGLDKTVWKQKHDGKTALIRRYSLPAFEQVSEAKTWFTINDNADGYFTGDAVSFVEYRNQGARFDAAGEAEFFELATSFNYGLGVSPNHAVVVGGGLAAGARAATETGEAKKFKLDRLPGWPEYFKDFAVADDGVAYGTTSGYRLVKIAADGTVEKTVPVY